MPIDRNGGQYITASPQQPTQSSAPGIWDIDEQGSAQAAGRWPLPPNVVQRSLRFDETAYFTRTPTTAGDRRTYVWSGWVKRSVLGATNYALFGARPFSTSTPFTFLRFVSDALVFTDDGGASVSTASVYRDPSAWYHVVLAVDTTNGTSANTVRIYVNGVAATLSSPTYPATNAQTTINSTNINSIGAVTSGASSYVNQFPGYMAEVNFIDGYPTGYNQTTFASLNVATLFGQTDAQTGQWIPRVYSGSYGTNGFRLQFLDNSGTTATTLGKDTSGMGNNWTPNNFSVTAGTGNDSLRDVPMNYYSPDNGLGGEVIGNYATFNPALPAFSGIITLSNGALDATTGTGGTTGQSTYATFAVNSGKWYWEATFGQSGSSAFEAHIGWATAATDNSNLAYAYLRGGQKVTLGTLASYGASYVANDVIGVALDMDAGTMTFYKNGVSQGTAFTGLTGTLIPTVRVIREASYTSAWYANFGQRPFAYTAPSGFKALCTQNFSAPRIGNVAVAQANDYFNTVLYIGTGSSLSVTGTGFQPDLVWIKSRSAATDHALYDAVRGVQNQLESNTTTAETAETTGLTAFGADGFTVGSLAQVNTNTATYVAWQWNAGGSTVTNTSGTITSSVRASQTAGFSVVTYTGTGANGTVGHGLSSAPQFLIVRNRDTVYNWRVWHTALSGTQLLYLNATDATATDATMWNSTIPTSSVFSVGTNGGVNESTKRIIAYCFAAVPGFSAFGSYTGNGSTDGPFIYLGFRPAWIMIKRSDAIENWNLYDNKRNPYNVADLELYPNLSNGEGTTADRDFLSNGFKIRSTNAGRNASGGTYIYAAFAEIPFQFANAR